ncbi:hypothetical protein KSP39_PZI020069 [Platanthera zijinensis]|uniref:MULE transposase domain-containing protein n=1 Tax=Platanthera zijinensis TaxID=2320716 RepID=A0AAP0B066_9ASPA
MKNQDTWEVRTVKDKHSCSREFNNKLLTAKWLGKRIESKVRENPNVEIKQIVAKVKEKWVVGISKDKASRAKATASASLEGSVEEQYNYMNQYCAELLRSNQGSSVFLKFSWPPEFYNESIIPRSRSIIPRFEICRPIVGLDGCFLKGYYGGQLLTAIGRDPNDQMLPIAYAIVEAENKDSWSWFLDNLSRDIGSRGITYISDQQKVCDNFIC